MKFNLEWPEEEEEILSDQAVDAIQKFLILDPNQRASFSEMQEIELFKDIDWNKVTETEAPFIPQPDDDTDTGYFEARNEAQQWRVSQIRE